MRLFDAAEPLAGCTELVPVSVVDGQVQSRYGSIQGTTEGAEIRFRNAVLTAGGNAALVTKRTEHMKTHRDGLEVVIEGLAYRCP